MAKGQSMPTAKAVQLCLARFKLAGEPHSLITSAISLDVTELWATVRHPGEIYGHIESSMRHDGQPAFLIDVLEGAGFRYNCLLSAWVDSYPAAYAILHYLARDDWHRLRNPEGWNPSGSATVSHELWLDMHLYSLGWKEAAQ